VEQDVEIQNSAGTALLSMKGAFSNAQETVSTSADTGSSWTIIESGTSKASGEYIDISGYKHVKFWAINDESTNAGISAAAHLSTSGSSNSGVSVQNTEDGGAPATAPPPRPLLLQPAHSVRLRLLFTMGQMSSDDTNHLWEAEFWGMDQTNVGIRTQQRSGGRRARLILDGINGWQQPRLEAQAGICLRQALGLIIKYGEQTNENHPRIQKR
jgi:hypothetical protein